MLINHHGDKFRLMFQDEAGFGRINKPKRCWCSKGLRPSVPCLHVREYQYAYGAVSPADGELFTLVMPYTNTQCMNVFLHELSVEYPQDYIMLVADNAAWHRSSSLVVPENIEIFPLLPYTPELNPIEMIWDDVREKGFRNEMHKTLSLVVDKLCDTLKALMNDNLRVRSITRRAYLDDAVFNWK